MEERGEGQKWRNGDENEEEGIANWSEGRNCEMTKKRLPNNASNAKEQATGATKKGGEKQ